MRQLNSFIKGHGRSLLLDLIREKRKIALGANPEADTRLLDFYRDPAFGFLEYVVQTSVYGGRPLHLFFSKNIDHGIEKVFESWYSLRAP